MFPTRWNWRKVFYYGEVLCFVSAWTVGVMIALAAERPAERNPMTGSIASSSDLSDVQATMKTK